MYELLGGAECIRSIVDHFYDLMDRPGFEPIRAMHASDLWPMRVALFEFLSGWLGGPPLYLQRAGSPCLTAAHAPFPIDVTARDMWLACMTERWPASPTATAPPSCPPSPAWPT